MELRKGRNLIAYPVVSVRLPISGAVVLETSRGLEEERAPLDRCRGRLGSSTELEKCAVDPRRAPERVRAAPPPD
jgi:hypothetical protein